MMKESCFMSQLLKGVDFLYVLSGTPCCSGWLCLLLHKEENSTS